jgi:deoxyadenosine/deoxycytidine kinase
MRSMPLVAEIVGPSGAGKSTLSGMLNDAERNVRAGLTVWGLPFSMLLAAAFLSVPALIGLCAERKRFRLDEIKQIIRLNAFYRRLKKESGINVKSNYKALFLDEGIVFALAKLRADRAADAKTHKILTSKWEENALNRWSEMLNAVIWLDAPDHLLIERIRCRTKQHRMKHKPDDEIYEFLARYRASYEQIINELKSRGRISVIKFRTDDATIDRMANEIFQFVERKDAPY